MFNSYRNGGEGQVGQNVVVAFFIAVQGFAGGVAEQGSAVFQTCLGYVGADFTTQEPLCPTQILQGSHVSYLPEKWDLGNSSISWMLSSSITCAISKCDNKELFWSSHLLMWTSSKK